MKKDDPIPVQPVEQPILCSPYVEPDQHWIYERSGFPRKVQGRRPAQYFYKDEKTGSAQLTLEGVTQEQSYDLGLRTCFARTSVAGASRAFCNRGTKPGDTRYPRRALVICPNLTIRERLDVR